jgi:hypothetical protein
MDTNVAAACIELCLRHIQQDLEDAAAIAKAANACAEAGNPKKAIEIALDIEQLINEAETLPLACSIGL